MEIIYNNPFRVLGLPVTASDRQIAKRVNDLSTCYEFGKSVSYDTDLPFLPGLKRTTESIAAAARRIELPERKLHYGNFWFWNVNSVDELVFDVLQEGRIGKALDLWGHAIENKPLSARTFSNVKNHALLSLVYSKQDKVFRAHPLKYFAKISVAIFLHPAYLKFAKDVVGKTYEIDAETEISRFADELSTAIVSSSGPMDAVQASVFIESFSGASSKVQWHVRKNFTARPIQNIERLLESATAARNADPEAAYDAGLMLAKSCTSDLGFLRGLLPANDEHLQRVADKIADELLDCSTCYFNETHEDDPDGAIQNARKLTELAKQFSVGQRSTKRVEEDLEQIARIEQQRVFAADVDALQAALGAIPNLETSDLGITSRHVFLQAIKDLLLNTRSPLDRLRTKGGQGAELHEQYGGLVAVISLGMCIKYANETEDFVTVQALMNEIGRLPMDSEQRQHYASNKAILDRNASASQNTSSGCYIATLVYGGSDQPEVMVLREFRDSVLLHHWAGRVFVRVYYCASPTLVSWLTSMPAVQQQLRKALDHLVRRIS